MSKALYLPAFILYLFISYPYFVKIKDLIVPEINSVTLPAYGLNLSI
tara:strand:+ start:148 stop:288 length:141 start_codon:yes stop_codon:yes gene_type:complete